MLHAEQTASAELQKQGIARPRILVAIQMLELRAVLPVVPLLTAIGLVAPLLVHITQ